MSAALSCARPIYSMSFLDKAPKAVIDKEYKKLLKVKKKFEGHIESIDRLWQISGSAQKHALLNMLCECKAHIKGINCMEKMFEQAGISSSADDRGERIIP